MGGTLTFANCKSITPTRIIDGVAVSGYEQEFLIALCSDSTYTEIGIVMHRSGRTIEGYRDALFRKLDIHTRFGLMIYAIKHKVFIIE